MTAHSSLSTLFATARILSLLLLSSSPFSNSYTSCAPYILLTLLLLSGILASVTDHLFIRTPLIFGLHPNNKAALSTTPTFSSPAPYIPNAPLHSITLFTPVYTTSHPRILIPPHHCVTALPAITLPSTFPIHFRIGLIFVMSYTPPYSLPLTPPFKPPHLITLHRQVNPHPGAMSFGLLIRPVTLSQTHTSNCPFPYLHAGSLTHITPNFYILNNCGMTTASTLDSVPHSTLWFLFLTLSYHVPLRLGLPLVPLLSHHGPIPNSPYAPSSLLPSLKHILSPVTCIRFLRRIALSSTPHSTPCLQSPLPYPLLWFHYLHFPPMSNYTHISLLLLAIAHPSALHHTHPHSLLI
jgi:hypothetical protein